MITAFVGVAFIVRPAALSVSPGIFFGILSGLFGGAATLVIWSMSETESAIKQLFYFSIFCVILSIPLAWLEWQWPQPDSYGPIIALGAATTLAQYFLSKACTVAPADKINTWNYLSIVVSALAGYLVWGERLAVLTVAGMVLVVIGAQVTALKYQR